MSDASEPDIQESGFPRSSGNGGFRILRYCATVAPAAVSATGTLRIVSFSSSGATSVTKEMMKMIVE